tara:strand:- start:82 stop:900 length:819 start_codon:yes stop_codon:yes gene_type:complete
MKDYYAILGVPREAEADLIKATYIALSKIYHPDIYRGDKKYALKRMQEINEAYETLSDNKKRKSYDDKNKDTSDDTSFDDNEFQEEQSSYQNIIKEAWDFAKEYYPSIELQYNELRKINKNLAWQFQVICIENKQFENAEVISKRLRNEWLIKHFGENKSLQVIALKAIMSNNINIAKELNKAVKLLGESAHKVILKKLEEKYPDFFEVSHGKTSGFNSSIIIYRDYEYKQIKDGSGNILWRIFEAPKLVSIGMEFEDEKNLRHYIDFKENP